MVRKRTAIERFWPKFDVDPDTGCWVWNASTHHQGGYGHFGADGKIHQAHRWGYEYLVGPVPDGLVLDHLCRNPPCVNPRHLEPVTTKENVRRGLLGVLRTPNTHCKWGHEWTPENTYMSPRKGKPPERSCVECGRYRAKMHARRKRAAERA